MKRYFIAFIIIILFIISPLAAFCGDSIQGINNTAEKIEAIDKPNSPSDQTIKETDKARCDELIPNPVRSGCCSWHGGVYGCNEQLDRIICCDGTLSPSCTCSGY
jgi:hypothetical protein